MCLQNEKTDRHRGIGLLQQRMITRCKLFKGDEIAQRLTHLLPVDRNHVVVHPITGRIMTACRRALCDFALMVREH